MAAMQYLSNQGYVVLILLICLSLAATGDRYDHLYNSVFRFSSHPLSLDEMKNIIDQLDHWANTKGQDDPRVPEVAFWQRSFELNLERCNFSEFKTFRSRIQKARFLANKVRAEQGSPASDTILNLETYYQSALKKLMSFCSALIPGLYYHLQESTKNVFKDVVELTTDIRHYSRMSPYRIGENVARLMLKKSSRADRVQLGRSLGDMDLVREIYEKHSPCSRLIRAAESHEGFFDLVAKARYYPLKSLSFPCPRTETGYDNMKNCVDRVEVCKYISKHRQVLEIALDHIVAGEKMVTALAKVTTDLGLSHDDRYDSVFRYSSTQMNYYEVKGVLSVLDSHLEGLAESDPRRTEVSFWLTAALHHRIKCAKDDDDILRLNLEFDKIRADEAGPVNKSSALVFNLETFVEGIRARRLEFCEDNVGAFFINKLDKAKTNRAMDIKKLTADVHHPDQMDVYLLGQRVAELIKRRDPNLETGQSLLSTVQIGRLYKQYSPCPAILRSLQMRLYSNFYDLATTSENYDRASKELKEWIDVIYVCRFIERESEQVFENAASFLYLHL